MCFGAKCSSAVLIFSEGFDCKNNNNKQKRAIKKSKTAREELIIIKDKIRKKNKSYDQFGL